MAITYDEKRRLFHLFNRNVSYYFYVNSCGMLQHLYFGRRLDEISIEAISSRGDWSWQYYDDREKKEKMTESKYYPEFSLMESTVHGGFDKRGSDIVLRQRDGSYYTAFRYRSHRISKGKRRMSTLPSCTGGTKEATTLDIVLEDELSHLTMTLTYAIFEDADVLSRSVRFRNKTSTTVDVLKAASLLLDLPSSDYDLIHFHGEWSKEQVWTRHPLVDGKFEIDSTRGFTGHQENPFVILAQRGAGETHGECMGFHLCYSGNFSFQAEVTNFKTTRILFGVDDDSFSYHLRPRESVKLPEVLLSYSSSGLRSLSLTIHDFIRRHLMQGEDMRRERPIVFNSWDGIGMDFDTEKLIKAIDRSKEIGAELFVLDDGWFGRRSDDRTSLGDWVPNEEKLDLTRVIRHCHEQGLKFGIWVEPEMVSPDSDLARRHPEWILRHPDVPSSLGRHQFVLDMSNPEAVEDVHGQLKDLLTRYDIDYVKWDFNRCLSEVFSPTKSNLHQGEVQHRFILGTYRLLSSLREEFPRVMWETCASGGGRLDAGMIPYSMQIQASDVDDAVERAFMLYSYSMGYPLACFSSHVFRWKGMDAKSKAAIALFSGFGYEVDPLQLEEKDVEAYRQANDIYRRYHRECILEGDFYRVENPYEGNHLLVLSVSKKKDKAMVLFLNKMREIHDSRFLRLAGLDPEKKYWNSYDNEVHTGAYYEQVGINFIRYLGEFETHLILLEEKKGV